MDYEKKYKEALEIAKGIYYQCSYKPNVAAIIAETLRRIFPELAESEGEKVRKALIDFFGKGAKYGGQTNGVYDKDILAWLEKQGEKPKEATYTHEVETGNGNIKALVTEKVQLPKFKVKYAGSEYNVLEIKEIAGVTYYGIEDEPNHIDYILPNNCEIVSEQKPADNQKFNV